jgi:hypothetical protein
MIHKVYDQSSTPRRTRRVLSLDRGYATLAVERGARYARVALDLFPSGYELTPHFAAGIVELVRGLKASLTCGHSCAIFSRVPLEAVDVVVNTLIEQLPSTTRPLPNHGETAR